MTKSGITKLMKLIAAFWPDFAITEVTVPAWQLILADIPDDLGIQAAAVAIRQTKFAPKPADIVEAALSISRPDTAIDAGRAWELCRKAICTFGASRMTAALATLPDAVAAAARRAGWRVMCEENEEWGRKHFIDIYDSMQANDKQIGVMPSALQQHFRQAALDTAQPVSLAELLAPPKAIAPHTTSVSPVASNAVAFKKRPPSRTPEQLREQADLLRKSLQREVS